MGWQEDQKKRILARAGVTESKLRRQRSRLIRSIAVVFFLGVSIVAINTAITKKGPVVSINFRDRPGTVAEWKNSGFVKSIDMAETVIHVNESLWTSMEIGEKKAVTALLGVYLAEQRNAGEQKVLVRGDLSGKRLAVLDGNGLNIEK